MATDNAVKHSIWLLIWPDGTWCWIEERDQYAHKSDDYQSVQVPEFCMDEDAETLAQIVLKRGHVTLDDVVRTFYA